MSTLNQRMDDARYVAVPEDDEEETSKEEGPENRRNTPIIG